jgi:hypothetical protein
MRRTRYGRRESRSLSQVKNDDLIAPRSEIARQEGIERERQVGIRRERARRKAAMIVPPLLVAPTAKVTKERLMAGR